MNAEALKRAAARRAIDYLTPGAVVGVGTGSTVAHFIAAFLAGQGGEALTRSEGER